MSQCHCHDSVVAKSETAQRVAAQGVTITGFFNGFVSGALGHVKLRSLRAREKSQSSWGNYLSHVNAVHEPNDWFILASLQNVGFSSGPKPNVLNWGSVANLRGFKACLVFEIEVLVLKSVSKVCQWWTWCIFSWRLSKVNFRPWWDHLQIKHIITFSFQSTFTFTDFVRLNKGVWGKNLKLLYDNRFYFPVTLCLFVLIGFIVFNNKVDFQVDKLICLPVWMLS